MSSTVSTSDVVAYVNKSIAKAIPTDIAATTDKHIASATKLSIITKENLENAAHLLIEVKRSLNQIDDSKDEAFKPIKDAIKDAEKKIKPFNDRLLVTESVLKEAIATYHIKMDEQATKQSDRIQKRLEKGTMKIQTGMVKIAAIEQADTKIEVDGGWIQIRDGAPKVVITDLAYLPDDYLMRSSVIEAIRKEVAADIKKGMPLPKGAIITRTKSVAVGVTDE